jgi:4-hydroxy-2-oxoglutarate aldolase
MQPANMLAFYRTVADCSPLPIMLYSVPSLTGYDLPAAVAIELAEHPNIIGIKESGGDIEKIRRMADGTSHVKRSTTVTMTFDAVTPRMWKAENESGHDGRELVSISSAGGSTQSSSAAAAAGGIKTRQKEIGFQVLAGAADKLHPSLNAGAVGAVLAFADPAPTACYEIYAAWKEGDHDLARLKQERISKAAYRVGAQMGIPALKYAMDLNGYFGGTARLPLLSLTSDEKSEVEQLMADIRN